MRERSRTLLGVLLALIAVSATGHEVRPAFLHLVENQPGEFEILWKQPMRGDRRLAINPVLPDSCAIEMTRPPQALSGALVHRWYTRCEMRLGSISISGLSRTLTDVMVQIDYFDGGRITQLLQPADPSLDLSDPTPQIWSYLRFGVEHLLFGVDHILFVVGLVLFIPSGWSLVKTVTAFTAAHSITLGLSVLGAVTLAQRPVEAVIALSILFLARELMVAEEKRSRLTQARPWLMACVFGLLHGFGFAGALAEIGLPQDQLAPALFLFNLGIEIGQLFVIGALLTAGMLISRVWKNPGDQWPRGFGLAMGLAAAFLTTDRMLLVF